MNVGAHHVVAAEANRINVPRTRMAERTIPIAMHPARGLETPSSRGRQRRLRWSVPRATPKVRRALKAADRETPARQPEAPLTPSCRATRPRHRRSRDETAVMGEGTGFRTRTADQDAAIAPQGAAIRVHGPNGRREDRHRPPSRWCRPERPRDGSIRHETADSCGGARATY